MHSYNECVRLTLECYAYFVYIYINGQVNLKKNRTECFHVHRQRYLN